MTVIAAVVGSRGGRTGGGTPSPRVVNSVVVSSPTFTIIASNTQQFAAQSKDQYGANIVDTHTWMSSNAAVATVDGAGLITGVAPGTVTITATSVTKPTKAANAGGTVTAAPVVTTVVVSPSSLSIGAGATQQLTVQSKDQYGATISDTFTWGTSNAGIATVSGSGLVTGGAGGTATITATSVTAPAKLGTSNVTVVAVPVVTTVVVTPSSFSVATGATQQLTAQSYDQFGATISDTFTWGSSNTGLATVNGSGLVTGVAAGAPTITATSVTDPTRNGTSAATVTASGSAPSPGVNDNILFDVRTTLQSAGDLAAALALYGPDSHHSDTWNFTTDYDGNHTHALRADWNGQGNAASDYPGGPYLYQYFPEPWPFHVFYQVKVFQGKTATGGGVGNTTFKNTNPNETGFPPGTAPAGRKMILLGRDFSVMPNLWRIDTDIAGPAPAGHPTQAPFVMNLEPVSYVGTMNQPIQRYMDELVGQIVTLTIEAQAATAANNDGIYRLWINSDKIIEVTNVPGHVSINQLNRPVTFRSVAQDQTEFWYDDLAWEPLVAPGTPTAASNTSVTSTTMTNSVTLAAPEFSGYVTTIRPYVFNGSTYVANGAGQPDISPVGDQRGSAVTVVHTGLTSGTLYAMKYAAVNALGASALSVAVMATTN